MKYTFDALFIAAQLVGFTATGIAIASYQAKKRITLLSMQTLSNLLWLIHYFMLGSLSAVFANSIGVIRNVIYGLRGKYKFAESKIVPTVAVIICIVTGYFTYTEPFDILPTLAMVLASIAFFIDNEKVIRFISIFIALSWITFGIHAGSIASIVADGMTLISVIIAIIRYRNFDIYDKKTPIETGIIENKETKETQKNN